MPSTGKLTDPAWCRARARKAALASHTLHSYARRVVAGWPKLTDDQRDELRGILAPIVNRTPTPDSGEAA